MLARPQAALLAVSALLALSSGCDWDDPVRIPPFGTLIVTTVTMGENLDATGYRVRVTGSALDVTRSIGVNDSSTFSVVGGCDCRVELSDIADNCAVDLNPQTVRVDGRDVETVTFGVSCN